MRHFSLFLFTLASVSSILPSGLALPRRSSCPTDKLTYGGPPSPSPSPSSSLPPNVVVPGNPGLTPSPIIPESTSTPLPTTTSNPGGSTPVTSPDIQTYLDAHNTVRAKHGASPLEWSDELASKAQQWAARCQFEHSGGQLGQFGENLAAGTAGDYGIAAAVKSWTDEVSSYNPNNPVPSHFTQVVWKSTTHLGCFLQICDNNNIFDASIYGPTKFIVCEYSPPGNVIGQFGENVQA